MKYLAIRDKDCKGVYSCENKKEQSNLMRKFQGCSMKVFEENEKMSAYNWAGIQMIQPLPTSGEKKDGEFDSLLNLYLQMGYDYVTLFLNNNTHYTIFLKECGIYKPVTIKELGNIIMVSECYDNISRSTWGQIVVGAKYKNSSFIASNISEIRPYKFL